MSSENYSGEGGRLLKVESKELPLMIVYKNKRYLLILTRNDKLILNKISES